ncbi:MAG TPA: TRC40/GET3/ArsA family transport-energizing ATPase [Candidatus Nanopelagicales bacterium]|nr:TRC40/GET3/ArsA family transport-energizing ATPase [Candidatus Nanopelagicales bacterium]
MRVLLVVGKGGVGKTTLAAATALAAARDGERTLVVSTDPAHSLTDVLGMTGDLGRAGEWRTAAVPQPVTGAVGDLDVLQIDTRARLDESWASVRRVVGELLGGVGVDPLVAAEIAAVPGVDDVLALLEVADHVEGYDAVVVDCAPTAETLRLLALPEALERLVARGLPVDRRIAKLLGGPGLSAGAVDALDALDDLARRLVRVRDLLTGPDAAVRLVTTPERVVLAETHRSRTTLAMLGHHVDGVVVNRAAVGEEWPQGVVARHREGLVAARDRFADLPVRVVPHTDTEPIGVEALLELGRDLFGSGDALDLGAPRASDAVSSEDGAWFIDVRVPGARPDDLGVSVTDDGDLVVDLGPHRRVIALPPLLRRCDVAGASLDLTAHGQVVRVRFDPDLDRWSTAVAP